MPFRALFLFLLCSSSLPAQVEKLRPGMDEAEVRRLLPGLLPDQPTFSKSIRDSVTAFGLEGTMNYFFTDGLLEQMSYDAQQEMRAKDPQATIEIYQRMLAGARLAVQDYNKRFGRPQEYREQNVENYNAGANTTSTSFISASWKCKEGGAVRLAFYFSGNPEGGEANAWYPKLYLLNINYEAPCSDFGWPFRPGMSAHECARLRPDLFPNGITTTGIFWKEERLQGLKGHWMFCMHDGLLLNYRYKAVVSDAQKEKSVNEKVYKKYSAAVKRVLQDYQLNYGKNSYIEHREPLYVQVENRDLTKLLAADWETEDRKIAMNYSLQHAPLSETMKALEFEIVFYGKNEQFAPPECD